MNNFSASEKSRGILALANNTSSIDYQGIAKKTLELASHHLDIPCQVVSTPTPKHWLNHRNDTDTQQRVEWLNHNRFQVYDLSPWDETIVIDADYLVTTNKLNLLFASQSDLVFCHHNHMLHDQSFHTRGLQPIWATVFFFRKGPRAQHFFDLVGRIQKNYSYYRQIFGILQSNFRNDMAFAMAEKILYGYALPQQTRMPWGITTVDAPVQSIDINQDWMVVRTEHGADILPRQDLHVQSKAWLQSTSFDQFLQQARQ